MSEPIRYIVESIEPENETFFRDLEVGDTIEVPDGFPSRPDQPEPGKPVVILREPHPNIELHPNIAWFLGSAVDEGTVVIRRVTSSSSEESAIFDLIRSVGGKMPGEVAK